MLTTTAKCVDCLVFEELIGEVLAVLWILGRMILCTQS